MRLFGSLALLGIAAVAVDGLAQTPGQRLTAAEIPGAAFGHTWQTQSSDGRTYVIAIAHDGAATMTGTHPGATEKEVPGRYFVRDGKLCRFWQGIDQGREACFDAHRNGNRIVLTRSDGQITSVWTPAP